MGEHRLINVPGGNKSAWEKTPPGRQLGNLIHMSKELVPIPRFAIGSDPKDPTRQPVGYDYALAKDGSTFRREAPKAPSARDAHRMRSGTARANSWGAEWALSLRDRQDDGARQRKAHAEWKAMQAQV